MKENLLDSALKEAFGELATLPGGSEPLIGRDTGIEKYELLHSLGEGGMGEVVLAYDRTLQRKVALKSIRSVHRLKEQARARFVREARILAELEHPNICRIHDYVVGTDHDYLVLEYVDGETLTDVIQRQPEFREKLAIATAIGSVLASAHAHGIIHRDLKPGNVMIAKDGTVKVLDFGISSSSEVMVAEELNVNSAESSLDELQSYQTEMGALLGTPQYMSPEQASGHDITIASDMFAMGLVLQELFTGKPARKQSQDVLSLLESARRGEAVCSDGIDKQVQELILELLSFAPPDRPTAEKTVWRLQRITTRGQRRLRQLAGFGASLLVLLGITAYVFMLRDKNQQLRENIVELERRAKTIGEQNTTIKVRLRSANVVLERIWGLRQNLDEFGQTKFVDEYVTFIAEYFEALEHEMLTREELAWVVHLHYEIGTHLFNRGDGQAAATQFVRAREFAIEQCELYPDDLGLMFELGQSEYYAGEVFLNKGIRRQARAHMESYAEISAELQQRAPESVLYGVEVAYSRYNLAVLAADEGAASEAVTEFESLIKWWETFEERYPEQARVAADFGPAEIEAELADLRTRIGDTKGNAGDWAGAHEYFTNELNSYRSLLAQEPKNFIWRFEAVGAENKLALSCLSRGRVDEALAHSRSAVEDGKALVNWDPENRAWQVELGVNKTMLGDLLQVTGDVQAAREQLLDASETLDTIYKEDPSNVRSLRHWMNAQVALLRLNLIQSDFAEAQAIGDRVEARLRNGKIPVDAQIRHRLQIFQARLLDAEGKSEAAAALRRETFRHVQQADRGGSGTQVRLITLHLELGELDQAASLWAPLKSSGFSDPRLLRLLEEAGIR